MKTIRSDRLIILGIFVIALILRLLFMSGRPLPPLKWDSVGYWSRAGDLAGPINSWAEGKEIAARLAKRGPVYPAFLSLFRQLPARQLAVARAGQAVLDALVCAALYILGVYFGSRLTGLIAGLLAAVYTPLIFSSSNIMQECLTGFLVMLIILLLIKATIRYSPGRLFLSGLLVAALMLCRRMMLYLPLFLIIPVIIATWHQKKRIMSFIGFVGGIAAGILPWLIFITVIPPRYPSDVIFGYGDYPWAINFLETDGWAPDIADYTELAPRDSRIQRESAGTYSPEERISMLYRTIRYQPKRLLAVFLKNMIRQWSYPYIAYWPPLILSDLQLFWVQRTLLVLALIGLPLSFISWRKALIIMAFLAYCSVLVPLVIVEPRLTLPVMPLVLFLAAFALSSMGAALYQTISRQRFPILLAPAAIVAGGSILLAGATLPILSGIFPGTGIDLLRAVRITLINLWLIGLLWFLYRLISIGSGKSRGRATAVFFALAMGGVINFSALTDTRWTSWICRLESPTETASQEFLLPANFNLPDFFQPSLFIDMQKDPGLSVPVTVTADGRELPVSFRPRSDQVMLPIYATGAAWRGISLENVRQWVAIPLDIALLQDRRLTVAVSLKEDPGGDRDYLSIWGDYQSYPGDRNFLGPGLPGSSGREHLVSVYKWMTDWDKRIDRRMELKDAQVISRFLKAGRPFMDLSPDRGLQTGSYRIRLMIRRLPRIILSNFNREGPVNYLRGVAHVIAAPEKNRRSYPDFLHPHSRTGTAYLLPASSSAELTWVTDDCPDRKRTILEFVGNVSRIPGEVELMVNNQPVLTFQTDTSEDTIWRGGGCELLFQMKQAFQSVKTHRNCYSGIYFLSVPADLITEGRPIRISARFLRGDPESWFLIKDYAPTTRIEYLYF